VSLVFSADFAVKLFVMYTPKFNISNKILRNIASIEASKEVIENAPLVPFYEKKFKSDALIRSVYHSTHIEGSDLTIEQTKRIIEGEEITARERDIQEVINYRNMIKLLDELAAKRGGYSLEDILEIHKELVRGIVDDNEAGVLRKTQVIVKNEETGEIVLSPPSFLEVPYILEDFLEWLNSEEGKEVHPILRAGIAHYILVAVHPFVEGNGRTARGFSNLIMVKEGYDIKRFFSLEEHFDSDVFLYYKSLAEVDKQSKNLAARDLTSWLEYFTEVVNLELAKVKERVRKISVDLKLKGKIGEQVTLTERQMKLVEYLSEYNQATMQELKNVLPMVSEDTILRDIEKLLEKKVIRKEGKTKGAKYIINR